MSAKKGVKRAWGRQGCNKTLIPMFVKGDTREVFMLKCCFLEKSVGGAVSVEAVEDSKKIS